jgi:hypothetical protein
MGWSRSGDGDDRISDEGADRLLSALKQFAERRGEGGRGRPSLAEVLATARAALRQHPEGLVADPTSVPSGPAAVEVRMRDASSVSVPPEATALGQDAVQRMRDAFDDVAADYLGSELARPPRLSELLATLAFVLRVEGTRYMEDTPDELPIERIVLRPGGSS